MSKELISEIFDYIKEANKILEGKIYRTPIDKSHALSKRLNADVYLKLENFQRTGAFKIRGAYYTLWRTLQTHKISCCVTASSGNHAQGVALAASELGLKAYIVMPETTPHIKVKATREYGAHVILHGRTYDDAYEKALEIRDKYNAFFVHPFNDKFVIAGQGTIGLEIYNALKKVDIVLVPVGGGGLISGIAIAIKQLSPTTKVIGVQPKGAPAMALSYKQGKLIEVKSVDTIADAVIVKKPGDLTLSIMKELVDDMILVDDDDIIRAIFLLLERSKIVAEPAGALSVAALLSGQLDVKHKRVVCVISGGNIDMTLLSRIINKALVLEGRQIRLSGILPDRPGMLKSVLEVLAEEKANIVDIEHDRYSMALKPGKAKVTIMLEIHEEKTLKRIIEKLKERGFTFNIER